MSTYKRTEGDLAIQVYLPRDLGLEIGKLRLLTRQTNNVIVTQLLREALTARGLLDPSDTPAPKTETKESNAGTSGKQTKSGKPKVKKEPPGPPYVMRNPQKSLIAAVRGSKPLQVSATRAPTPTPAVTEVSVTDSVSVQDVAEPAVVAAPVARNEFEEMLDQCDDEPPPAAKAATPVAAPVEDDDDEIDIAALAVIDDEPKVELDPFSLVDTTPKATVVAEDDLDEIVTNPFDLSHDDDAPVLDPFKLLT